MGCIDWQRSQSSQASAAGQQNSSGGLSFKCAMHKSLRDVQSLQTEAQGGSSSCKITRLSARLRGVELPVL
jgi:hypothetical protein